MFDGTWPVSSARVPTRRLKFPLGAISEINTNGENMKMKVNLKSAAALLAAASLVSVSKAKITA